MENTATESHFKDIIKLKKGQVLFVEGEASAYLYIIVQGKVRVVKENDSELIPISVVGDKSFLGELSMFSDEPRSACAFAIEDTDVLMIKKSEIKKVIKSCPLWVSEIMETLSNRLRSSIEILREHKIVEEDESFDPAELKKMTASIQDYRERRGLN